MPKKVNGTAGRLKDTWRSNDHLSANWANKISKYFNGAHGEHGITVSLSEKGLVVSGGGGGVATLETNYSFYVENRTDLLVALEGFIHIEGRSVLHVPAVTVEDDVKLDGGPYVAAHVYLAWNNHATRGIALQTFLNYPDDIPHSDATFLRWPLFVWQFDAETETYSPVYRLWDRDIHIGTAL